MRFPALHLLLVRRVAAAPILVVLAVVTLLPLLILALILFVAVILALVQDQHPTRTRASQAISTPVDPDSYRPVLTTDDTARLAREASKHPSPAPPYPAGSYDTLDQRQPASRPFDLTSPNDTHSRH